MAGFCTKCGKPLPESGVCPCTMQQQPVMQQQPPVMRQQPPAAQQGYVAPQYSASPSKVGMALGGSLKNLPNLWVGYFRDPVGTTRLAADKRDAVSGAWMLALQIVLSLLGTLFFALIHLNGTMYYKFGDVVLSWLGISFLGPILAFGVSIGLIYVLAGIAKQRVDIRSAVAMTGASSVIPTVLLLATMLLGMIGSVVFELFAILLVAAWAVSFFTNVTQVLNIKLNIINTFVLILAFMAAYYLISVLLGWFLYDGEILSFAGLLINLG